MSSSSPAADDESATSESAGLVERIRARWQPPRLLSVTRSGKFFLLLTLAVGFGAINTGQNLLFLVLGATLSLIIASGILSEGVLRNLRVRRRLPRRLTAEQPATAAVRIINDGAWPALSIEASEQNPQSVAGPRRGDTFGPDQIPWWKFWQSADDQSRPLAAAYCMKVASSAEESPATHYEFPTRGRWRLPGLQLKTRFPFGLFEKTRQFSAPTEVTVFPRSADASKWVGRLDARWGESAQDRRGRGEEFYGLREYRPGEDQRLIHWKSTARRDEPVVRETEARRDRAVLIVFDNRAPDDDPSPAIRDRFESGVRHVAGLLRVFERRGWRVHLSTTDGYVAVDEPGDVDPLLRHLAVTELQSPHAVPPSEDAPGDAVSMMCLRVGFGAVVSSGTSDDTVLTLREIAGEETP